MIGVIPTDEAHDRFPVPLAHGRQFLRDSVAIQLDQHEHERDFRPRDERFEDGEARIRFARSGPQELREFEGLPQTVRVILTRVAADQEYRATA